MIKRVKHSQKATRYSILLLYIRRLDDEDVWNSLEGMLRVFVENREARSDFDVVIDNHLLVFQLVHQEHKRCLCFLRSCQLSKDRFLIVQLRLNWWHQDMTLLILNAVAAEWEAGHEAIQAHFWLIN